MRRRNELSMMLDAPLLLALLTAVGMMALAVARLAYDIRAFRAELDQRRAEVAEFYPEPVCECCGQLLDGTHICTPEAGTEATLLSVLTD